MSDDKVGNFAEYHGTFYDEELQWADDFVPKRPNVTIVTGGNEMEHLRLPLDRVERGLWKKAFTRSREKGASRKIGRLMATVAVLTFRKLSGRNR